MSCYLEHKEAINNLKSDLKKSGYKPVLLGRYINEKAFREHNRKVAEEVVKIQKVVDNWNNSLKLIGLSGSVVKSITREFKGDIDATVGFSRKLIDIVYNEELLNKIDDLRKSIGIYDSKLSFASYLKEQKQKLYSQYLESLNKPNTNPILQGNQKQIDESEITYTDEEGKPCAKMGGRSDKFTKGSQWEIVKDLKGYPSHAQGGVDIKLGKDGFSFTGKQGTIKAAYGLILPKIK